MLMPVFRLKILNGYFDLIFKNIECSCTSFVKTGKHCLFLEYQFHNWYSITAVVTMDIVATNLK